MTAAVLTPDALALLQSVDTPTVCNAIEVAQGQRGFAGFSRGTFVASEPDAPAMVGYARTASLRGAAPAPDPPDTIRARRLAYFRHMAQGDGPAVAVIEDRDHPGCIGAWWGEVHVAVHKGLGLAGAVTNGLIRDLGDLDDGFPVLAGGIGVSHGFVHVVDFGAPVTVFGLQIRDGDLIHADMHGAVVIPPDVLGKLPKAIETLHASEQLILGPARDTGFDIDALEVAWAKFEAART